ncbi:MAG: peptidoglycan-binding domain-containing protein [Solirubrobacteraceae bacterium]
MRLTIVDGCPCPSSGAPQVQMVLRHAGQTAASIYRGEDARELLHRYGKHTQAEIHRMYPAISNPAGRSQHELCSDGYGNPGPVGRRLEEWQVGVDSGGNDPASKARIEAAARHYGWVARHPYSRGVEGHHWCFAAPPVLAVKPLRLGSRGPRVRALQRRLRALGYASVPVKGRTHGFFGRSTQSAVKRFQRAHGLTATGRVGTSTTAALKRAVH